MIDKKLTMTIDRHAANIGRLLNKVENLENELARQIKRLDLLFDVFDDFHLTSQQQRQLQKAWWGRDDE